MILQDTFIKRFKERRKAKNLTQEALGVKIGLDEFVASTRINRYEKGNHHPDLNTLQRIAEALDVPPSYFFADDELAKLIQDYHESQKQKIINT